MKPRICISILPKNPTEARKLIEDAQTNQADLIEVRMDLLNSEMNLGDLVKNKKIPLIATKKMKTEQGFFEGSEAERQKTLIKAAKEGFEYIDVDFNNPKRDELIAKLKESNTKIIISYHKYDGVLNETYLEKIMDAQILSKADVCKIVLTANQIQDNLPVLSFISKASTKTKLVCFCMGQEGKISRLLSPIFGAFFTFASLNKDYSTAPGQMTIKEMRAAYNLLGIEQ